MQDNGGNPAVRKNVLVRMRYDTVVTYFPMPYRSACEKESIKQRKTECFYPKL